LSPNSQLTDPPLFVLGAGFGADAGVIVGPIEAQSIYIGRYRFTCGYPLVRDLPRICFPSVTPSVRVVDVEARLADELKTGNHEPVDRLCEELSKADYYLAPRLVGWPDRPNVYAQFFADFPGSSYATYNYDAFVEFALFRLGKWSPHDGFGVEVAVDVGFTAEPYELRPSKSLVLHLHGTYLVYAYQHQFSAPDRHNVQWMERFDTSRFAFDPHALGNLFYPCERHMAGLAYSFQLPERVIAPVPNKASGLATDFVRRVREQAMALAIGGRTIVAIGYAFGDTDRESYLPLLDAANAGRSRVVVVAPDASGIVKRLRPRHTEVDWSAQNYRFSEWVTGDYPGLKSAV
jgi:hypothetical protein